MEGWLYGQLSTFFMLDCIDNLIGIKGTCGAQTAPDSGLYLQDLPNINISVMDAAIGKEAISAYDELARKLELAGTLCVNELRTALSSRFRLNAELENSRVGFVKENLETQAAQAKYIGANIRVNAFPFLELFVSRIGVQMQTSGAVDLKVIDLITGTILETITITAVAKIPTYVDVYKKYKTNGQRQNIFIGYDATTKGSYKTIINPNWCWTCNGSWHNYIYSQARAVTIGLADTLIDSSITSVDNTGGVIVEYSLGCDIERFFCSVKYQFALAIWYRAGILVLDTIINSKRFNSLISLFQGEHTECRQYYQSLYDNQMKFVLNNLNVPNDICFVCNPQTKTEINLP